MIAGVTFLALVLLVGWRMKGPYRFYRADILAVSALEAGETPLEVGVAMRDITPDMSRYDTWTDITGNGQFRPEQGDTWTDTTDSGRFDAVWLAGFNNRRPATGVHDPLWVRAIAFRNGGVTLVLVTIDSIGIFNTDFITVRKAVDPALGITHVMLSSTHTHSAPDTMGLWSYSPIRPRFDHEYLALVQKACVQAVEDAVRNLRPARTTLAEVEAGPEGFVGDTRPPFVYDSVARCARFDDSKTGDTIATMVVWGNHPEALGARNTLVTSDFPHFLREGIENGVSDPGGAEGTGGMCLYFQGMIGGLMTPLNIGVSDRRTGEVLEDATFEKARALGENLAVLILDALRGPDAWEPADTRVAVAARSVFVPVRGLFAFAMAAGLLHPGYFWGKGRTEVNAFRVGDIEILTSPGELYPEIGDGGVVALQGRDFEVEPLEVPPLRSRMTGRMNMIIGLANDEIGYIIPKSQWDRKPPYVYGKRHYGEVNSCGPDVAPVLHLESLALLDQLHDALAASPSPPRGSEP